MKYSNKVNKLLAANAAGAFLAITTLTTACTSLSIPVNHSQVETVPSTTQSSVTKVSAPATLTTEPPSTLLSVTSSLKPCQTSNLSLRRVDGQGSMGHFEVIYAFTNTSSSACSLNGYPGFVLLNAKGQPLKGVKVGRSEKNDLHQIQQHPVILNPGAQASFQVAYIHSLSEGHCPSSTKVEVTPPNTYHHFTLVEHLSPCGEISVTQVEASMMHK